MHTAEDLLTLEVIRSMLIDADTPARKEWGVDEDQTIGCQMVLCTTGRTSVREIIRHSANKHGIRLVKRHDV